jgi:Tfp pilus assembly protein PilF
MSETPQHRPTPPPHGRSVRDAAHGLALAFAALALFGLAAGAWYWRHGGGGAGPAPHRGSSPPEDPRAAYAGPFLNVAPDVHYVGSAACADCHDRQSSSYRLHPMGRSMFPVAAADSVPPTDATHHNPFNALDSRFFVQRDGETVRHRRTASDDAGRPIYDFALEAAYVIGSGAHGHSYLSVREGGFVVQTPISWYTEKHAWDLSPGFDEHLAAGRAVRAECLYCHANHTEPVEGTVNRFREPVFDEGPAIGCERCHGPGERHVTARRASKPVAGGADFTIVNPGRLDPELRAAVCEQCHLAGEARVLRRGRQLNDFRPGLPLSDVLSVFVRASGLGHDNKAVNHVEQMYLSRCFRETSGDNKLGCVSCHDPHVHVTDPAERVAHYRDSCLACHRDRGCSLPRAERVKGSPQDSCIDCHMPRKTLGNIPHTAGTDHRIVRARRDDEPDSGLLPTGPSPPIRAFYLPEDQPVDPEMERDLAVALLGPLGGGGKIDPVAYSGLALRLLELAVARDPEDWDAWEAKANALRAQGRNDEALACLKVVLAKAPNRETALASAAGLAQNSNQLDLTLDYWRRAVEVNPWSATYRQSLCAILVHQKGWDDLRPHAEAWMRLDPAAIEARQTWVIYLLRTGRRDEARAEFDRIRALHPKKLDQLQAWFERESK